MGYGRWSQGIEEHIVRWTDWYTDWIFCQATSSDDRIIPVQFPFSRFFCDVERLEKDPLESIGQGIIYTDFEACHRKIEENDRRNLLGEFYYPFIDRLRTYLRPSAFLLDCHSFPPDLSDIDVCIGFNDDWSRPEDEILFQTEAVFKSFGFMTGLNYPYSNSLSPKMPFAYQSMMIELNKKTYLSKTGELDYSRTRQVITAIRDIYGLILSRNQQVQ